MNKSITFHTVEKVSKGWGHETIFVNHEEPVDGYSGKMLVYSRTSAKSSMHYHLIKHETFYVLSGEFLFHYFDLENATRRTKKLVSGDVVSIPPGNPHQLVNVGECEGGLPGMVIEFASRDYPDDNYRIEPGNSQKNYETADSSECR